MIDGVEDKDLEEMDKVIKEKEEILTTLLDTVKNYAVMKTEFEKLLDTINGLEQQRKEMEIELEKAKHATTSLNPAAKLGLEKLKEKFERVNKELNSLKTERKSKESAYRLIQRDAKQCETLKKDLQKLKESKVVLIRQQKAQSQQILKMRKEQAQKVSSMKRSDVKKQQQMNSLKGKLAVKERVLDKKDAEIRRLTIKLSACNKHITQLLKIQHKSHARITNGKAGLSSTSDSSVFGSLSLPDQELLVSSKALLDSTVQERVERTQARVLYTKKSHYLQGLNKELALEAAELESLLERKKAMVADLRDKYGGMGSDLSNEGWEEEAVMTNSHLVVVMEDDRAELYSLLLSIDAVESNIERITKEQDHYNADLDSLSLKLEEQVDSVSTDRKCDHDQLPVGESSWDAVAREVVATLNLAQSHTLLWELLDEKTEALENLRISDDDLVKARADNIYYSERVVELSNQVTALRSEMRQRLDKVEKQRVMDIWALLQAQHKDSDDNSNTAVEDTASKIAVQRAQDLERELDGFLVNEEKLKLSNVEQEKTIEMLNQQIAELHLRIQDLDISAIDLQRYQSKDQIGNTNAKRVSLFEMKESQYLDKLLPIWNSLGVEKADREEIVQYVNKAKAMAKDRVIVDAEQQLSSTRRGVEVAEAELNLLCTALGLAPDQQIGNFNQMKTDLPLLQWLQQLKLAISDCGQQIESKFPNLLTLRERLANLKSEMMLRDDELSLNLSHLLSIDLVSLAQDSFDISNKPNDRDSVDSHISVTSLYHESLSHKIAIQLQLHQCSLKQVSAWENEIRKLNLDRVHYTQKGISLRDETVKLAKELSLSDKHSYSQILHQEESEVMTAVVQLILTNSSSNPPGSAKLVNALEQLKMTLECVKVNRINAAALMNKYVLLITEHFGLSVDSLGVEIMDQLESYQRQYLEMLHSRCEAIYPLLRSLRHKMGDQLFESIRATSNISENDTHGYASITMQINELIKAKASKISLITMQKTPAKDCLRRSSNSGLIPEEEESNSLLSYSSLLIKVVNFESNVQEVIADIADLKMLLDEEWLQKYMESVAQFWDLSCKSDATPANPMLNSSPNTTLRNAVREVVLILLYTTSHDLLTIFTLLELHFAGRDQSPGYYRSGIRRASKERQSTSAACYGYGGV